MAQWLDAQVQERIDWNDHLFSLTFTCADFPPYIAGQFTKFGLQEGEQIISRPYSLVSHPSQAALEILAVPVANGMLSPKLHKLEAGDKVKVMTPATGFLTLDEVPTSHTLWLLATGTGVGPFISILAGDEVWQRYQKIVLVYAVRHGADLAYTPLCEQWQANYPQQFCYVPIVSRETVKGCLRGRIPMLLDGGDIQKQVRLPLDAASSQIMLCGNPEMIQQATEVLLGMGLSKHLRRSPGQISMERYW